MKFSIIVSLIIFIILSFSGFGQYKYTIKLQSKVIKTGVSLQKNSDSTSLSVEIVDKKDKPFPFIKLKLQNSDTTIFSMTNLNGRSHFIMPSGEYTLFVNPYIVQNAIFNVKIQDQENTHLKFKFIKQYEILDIYSVKELSKTKLEEIKKCLQNSSPKECSCKEYSISIEI